MKLNIRLNVIEQQILLITRELHHLNKDSNRYRMLSNSLYLLLKRSMEEDRLRHGRSK